MPVLTIPNDFQPQRRIYSAEVDANFNAIATLLNTTGLDNTNIQNNGINPLTKIDASAGAANQILRKSGTQLAWSNELATLDTDAVINVGLTASVNANALTITLTSRDGSTALSSTDPAFIAFRSATATSGGTTVRTISSNLTLTIPSGTTIGTSNNYYSNIFVYAIDLNGTTELAVSLTRFDSSITQNTTAISGGSSDTVLYSQTARTGASIRLIGVINAQQATAGTWASAPTLVQTLPIRSGNFFAYGALYNTNGSVTTTSYAEITNSPTITVIAPVTGLYKVSCRLTVTGSAGAAPGIRIADTAGSPIGLYYDELINELPNTNGYPIDTYAIFLLKAGTSYTFKLAGKVSSGTLTCFYNYGTTTSGGRRIMVEQID